MNNIHLINGVPAHKHIFSSLIFIIVISGGSFWALYKFFKGNQDYQHSINQLDSLFIFYILHYGYLIGSIALLLLASEMISFLARQIIGFEKTSLSKKIDKIFINALTIVAISIIPFIVSGHFYAKHQFGQAGYTQCNVDFINNRYKRAYVLDPEDCHDSKLQWILTQRAKNNTEIIQESHAYLRDKNELLIQNQ